MKPTNKLRFVLRDVFVNANTAKKQTVLQQWWAMTVVHENAYQEVGEWRNVPVEAENA